MIGFMFMHRKIPFNDFMASGVLLFCSIFYIYFPINIIQRTPNRVKEKYNMKLASI